ncbi:MAG: carboxyltransferase domain-containing protein [Bacteroidota bacterium]
MYELLHFPDASVQLLNFGADFLLLRSDNETLLAQLGAAIYKENFDFVVEVIVTEKEICLQLNNTFTSKHRKQLERLNLEDCRSTRTYQLPVFFEDHPDWATVENHSGQSKTEVVQALQQLELNVAMFGFLPGFVYLKGLPQQLQVPRKKVPAKYVAAHSLAMGGPYLGVYSLDSPGGWQVIGKVATPLLQWTKLPLVALHPGDRIRLQSIDQQDYQQLTQQGVSIIDYNAEV